MNRGMRSRYAPLSIHPSQLAVRTRTGKELPIESSGKKRTKEEKGKQEYLLLLTSSNDYIYNVITKVVNIHET